MKILVTDGDSRAALAIVRSLGKAGHEVIVGSTRTRSLAGASKYCGTGICYPDPDGYRESFVNFIAEYVADESVDVLLPVTDITTMSIGANRDRFPASCALPFPDIDTVNQVADKAAMLALAERLGVDVPRSRVLLASAEVDPANPGLAFPVVIKPFKSRVQADGGWIYTGVSYATTAAELEHALQRLDPRIYPVLLQEKIVGPGMGLCVYAHQGTTFAAFSHRRLREKPPSGGVSVLRESAELDPLALRFSETMLQELGWHGVAMVEFKQDVRDGRPKLMEINGRFWGSLQLAIDAGVDFPKLLIDAIQAPPSHRALEYRIGVRTRWLWGDVDALMIRLFHTAEQLDLPPGHPSKARYLRQFLTYDRNSRLEIERLDDPGPWAYETKQWLGSLLSALLPSG
ncbi:MAG: ATP-grasp domain-containing protein [Thiohalobacteraceae bacterium]